MTTKSRAGSLRHLVGQLMIVGIAGTELSTMERAWFNLLQPGGIILFRRNIESAGQTFRLLAESSAISTSLRCVDVEGGTVNRLRDLLAPIPSAAAVGATGSRELYQQHGRVIGKAVRMLGFNATFAPVLDLGLPESEAVMQNRSASAYPKVVARYGDAFLRGLNNEGIAGAGKHFPGLGGGMMDSHHTLPIIERSWQQMREEDLFPYRKLAAKLPIIMVAHAAYPAITHDSLPASVSHYWITKVLLGKLGYRGLVLSDDMEMGGILSQLSIEEAVVKAVECGTDIIEICHSPELIFRAYEALLKQAEGSRAFERRVRGAARKINATYPRLRPGPERPPAPKKIDALRKQIQNFSAAVEKARG